VNEILDWLLAGVSGIDPVWRNLIAGLAIMLETSLFIGLIVPGDTVVLVASTGVSDLPDFFWLVGAVLVGSMIGETLGFSIGRLFGKRIRASKLGQRFGEDNWARADIFVEKRGGPAVAISRFLPVLHSLVPVVAGATKMRYKTFIIWTFGACLVWASTYVGIGYIAKASYEEVASGFKFGALVFVGILALFIFFIHLAKKKISKVADKMIDEELQKTNK
jgi:membrane protein DedA with SNARE-associated domain